MNSDALLLNALAYGPVLLRAVLGSSNEFCNLFNSRWHGLSPNQVLHRLNALASNGSIWLEAGSLDEEFVAMDSSVWLTEQGGKEWEKAFSIRWEFYFDVILSDAFPNCLEVKATRESICRDAASFYRGCAAERGFRLEGGSPVGGENWKWSNWKNHKRYFSSRLVVEAPNPQPESCGLIYCPRAEALRAPWRAPA